MRWEASNICPRARNRTRDELLFLLPTDGDLSPVTSAELPPIIAFVRAKGDVPTGKYVMLPVLFLGGCGLIVLLGDGMCIKFDTFIQKTYRAPHGVQVLERQVRTFVQSLSSSSLHHLNYGWSGRTPSQGFLSLYIVRTPHKFP